MSGKRAFCLLITGIVALSWLPAAAATPWDTLFTFRRMEADPDQPYRLSEERGPWMILACSFSGENAPAEAHELVLELRRRYKLPAYVYEKAFDLGRQAPGRGLDRFGAPLKTRYRRGSLIEEVAVMVGNYSAVDSPEGQETLRKLKYYQPECLMLDENRRTQRSLAGWRTIQQAILAPGNEKKNKGPMGHAFITTNPMLPADYYVPKGVDKFVLALNEKNKYSLLRCPGRYTVQVARFTGRVIMDQNDIRAIEKGKKLESKLVQAGEKAEKLTEALRMKGYQAYVFHDRYASIVTVGSFDTVGTPRADGRTEIDPRVHAIMKTFGADRIGTFGQAGGAMKPKQLVGIFFDAQPIPVEVPKRSIGSDYSRVTLGMR